MLYLDIGTGFGYNTSVFGVVAKETIGLDVKLPVSNNLRKLRDACLIIGDGMNLPFMEGTVDMVSLFSVIEHVPDQEQLLKEVNRVLKTNGILIIQVPNRFFLVELHSGLPLFFYLPKRLRAFLTNGTKYSWLKTIDIPSIKNLVKLIYAVEPRLNLTVRKVKYSPSIITPKLKVFYRLASRIGFLDLLPLGYLVIAKKV
jgi:SAM-dependent methyltransferase